MLFGDSLTQQSASQEKGFAFMPALQDRESATYFDLKYAETLTGVVLRMLVGCQNLIDIFRLHTSAGRHQPWIQVLCPILSSCFSLIMMRGF